VFRSRRVAGRRLGVALRHLAGTPVTVLGLPRGGVPVAYEVACALHAPLDVVVVRKLGVPFQPELAMGAVGEDDARVVDDRVMSLAQVGPGCLAAVEEIERAAVSRAVRRYRDGGPPLRLDGRTAVLVDDGLATGSTVLAAVRVVRSRGAKRVVLAAPVASAAALDRLRREVDDVVCLVTPDDFRSVGQWYSDFSPVGDDTVHALLTRARAWSTDDCGRGPDPAVGDP
jgi:putative phosphoribosyl transferase